MPKRLEVVPFLKVPVGLMKCVACSDFRTQPGRMWLGLSKGGDDLTITCPVCQGTAEVPRFKYIDTRNGKEIDYERPGQKFVDAAERQSGITLAR